LGEIMAYTFLCDIMMMGLGKVMLIWIFNAS